ncbi:hypothetical protein FB468_2992 [Leucobacter komagatae]|uniref:Uncharacterized protein n=1 Tax=Leucobacter komagatae TaxID=55969 RepID=A0A542XXA7_9MICO|nr:hypothetical protein FB468_2992 [Leucobacter komagatae]
MPNSATHSLGGDEVFVREAEFPWELRLAPGWTADVSGAREGRNCASTTLAWLDTPSGVIVPFQQGGVFTRQQFALTLMPSWLVWKNILDVLPTSEDVELWNELAAATASERVRFGTRPPPRMAWPGKARR